MDRFGGLLPATTSSAGETQDTGAHIARLVEPGDIICLEGALGAGKTEFVRGACSELGVSPSLVTSPTFTIVNEYSADGLTVFHIDAYRVKHADEFFELGYEEYLSEVAVCFVEWPSRIAKLIPRGSIWLNFQHLGENKRRITAHPGK